MMRFESFESVVAAPANAMAMPKDMVDLPVGIKVDVDDIVPAKFISSQAYFGMKAEIKSIRRLVRSSDESIKEASLHHEQLDQQHHRLTIDINNIQDQLMKIDAALFEE